MDGRWNCWLIFRLLEYVSFSFFWFLPSLAEFRQISTSKILFQPILFQGFVIEKKKKAQIRQILKEKNFLNRQIFMISSR